MEIENEEEIHKKKNELNHPPTLKVFKSQNDDEGGEDFKKPKLDISKYGLVSRNEEIEKEDEILKEIKIREQNEKNKEGIPLGFEFKYKEPFWSSKPPYPYSLEVLKEGNIIDKINISEKGFYLFGRAPVCDVILDHESISRQHAIIQSRSNGNIYVYDLGSAHGTFIGKKKIKANSYVLIYSGDMLKFGNSSRFYILNGGPTRDELEEKLSQQKENLEKMKEDIQANVKLASEIQSEFFKANKKEEQLIQEEPPIIQEETEQIKNLADIEKEEEKISRFKQNIDFGSEAPETLFSGTPQELKEWTKKSKQMLKGKSKQKKSNKKKEPKKKTEKKAPLLDGNVNWGIDFSEEIDSGEEEVDEEEEERKRILAEYFHSDDEEDEYFDRTKKTPSKPQNKKDSTKQPETVASLTEKKNQLLKNKQDILDTLEKIKKNFYERKIDLEILPKDSLEAFMISNQLSIEKKSEEYQRSNLIEIDKQIEEVDKILKILTPALPELGTSKPKPPPTPKSKVPAIKPTEKPKEEIQTQDLLKEEKIETSKQQEFIQQIDNELAKRSQPESGILIQPRKEEYAPGLNKRKVPPPPTPENKLQNSELPSPTQKPPQEPISKKKKIGPQVIQPIYKYDDEHEEYTDWVPPNTDSINLN